MGDFTDGVCTCDDIHTHTHTRVSLILIPECLCVCLRVSWCVLIGGSSRSMSLTAWITVISHYWLPISLLHSLLSSITTSPSIFLPSASFLSFYTLSPWICISEFLVVLLNFLYRSVLFILSPSFCPCITAADCTTLLSKWIFFFSISPSVHVVCFSSLSY